MPHATDELRSLYRGRQGRVEFVDVPALDYLVVSGVGDPDSAAFAAAAQTLYAISGAARSVVQRRDGRAPELMPLEALWWVDDPARVDLLAAVALGFGGLGGDHRSWRWQAMIMQPPDVGTAGFEHAVLLARNKDVPAVDDVTFEQWTEGPAAQTLHAGPRAGQAPTVAALHDAIEAAGRSARGPQHEIYLRDPRRTEPERRRTVIRQPVAPA